MAAGNTHSHGQRVRILIGGRIQAEEATGEATGEAAEKQTKMQKEKETPAHQGARRRYVELMSAAA
jgi:hypothetical protein